MDKEANKIIKEMDLDALITGCIHHLSREISDRKYTPALFYEFRDHLAKAIQSVPPPPKGESPVKQMSCILEDFVRGTARIIVAMASVDPLILEAKEVISKDQALIIRRGIEDHMVGLVDQLIRKLVLDNHVEFTNFSPTKEGN